MSKDVIDAIQRCLQQGQDLVAATVVRQQGSTPRGSGARMAVFRDGNIAGTIGGGIIEARTIQAASRIFETREASIMAFDMFHDEVAGADPICGGRMEILLEHLGAIAENKKLFETIHGVIQAGGTCFAVTALAEIDKTKKIAHRALITGDGSITGELPYPAATVEAIKQQVEKDRRPSLLSIKGESFFIEPFFGGGVLYLFGAGHVSVHTAAVARRVGFQIVVLDDREQFVTSDRYPDPDQRIVLENFDDCCKNLVMDDNSYLAIVTRGHAHDKVVLQQALRTRAGYVGMIGSRRKRNKIYEQLKQEGFTEGDIARVTSPIGIEIGSDTPEEIAVSIVAELIKIRAAKRR